MSTKNPVGISGTTTRAKPSAHAGLQLTSPTTTSEGENHSVFSRALSLSTYFLSGVLSINLTQLLGTPLYLLNEDWYNTWIAFTKQSFGVLTMGLTQAFAPTRVLVLGDASVRGELQQDADGNLQLRFPDRMVLIANHQIYTDWLYLWWIAYCNGVHGRLYIVLKESLKRIPIIGWGMQLSQFIFLKRDWEKDKPRMTQAMRRLNDSQEPMWLLLFPEGTNLASSTRAKSCAWAQRNGIKDTSHVLLPRSTGLQFCLQELKPTVEYLYDCTIAYEGVRRGEYAQDIFTLKAGYLDGKPPKTVSMYWRRFALRDIPVHDQRAFQLWLTARWREKDLLIENYLRFGRFPADIGISRDDNGKTRQGCGLLSVPVRPSHWYEFLQIFAPMGVLAMVLYIFYGALPQKVWDSVNKEALRTSLDDFGRLKDAKSTASVIFNADSLFDGDKQAATFRGLGASMMGILNSPEAKSAVARANMVQKWLEDPKKFMLDNLEHLEDNAPKSNFLKELDAERKKRQGLSSYEGSFWKDLEALERARAEGPQQSRTVGAETKRKPPKLGPSRGKKAEVGLFWENLRTEEENRRGSTTDATTQPRNDRKLKRLKPRPSIPSSTTVTEGKAHRKVSIS